MTEEEKIFSGMLFQPDVSELAEIKTRAHNLCFRFNALEENDPERTGILAELLGGIGEGSFIQRPVMFHYGKHTVIGKGTFINFSFTAQDDARVTIGDHCDIGPNVTVVTPCHPMLARERRAMHDRDGNAVYLCYAKPVTIGNDVWIGANAVLCPGVTVGDGCVIGAGSVVTGDVPAGTFAAGNPCRVIREITEKDSMRFRPELLGEYTL